MKRDLPILPALEECCTEDFDRFESSKKLFATYNAWARYNHKKRMGGREFLNAMRNQTVYPIEYHKKTSYERDEYGRPNYESERPWGFDGIKLTKDPSTFSTFEPMQDKPKLCP
jgi:hypothetical protein